jgi:hypothetical protein
MTSRDELNVHRLANVYNTSLWPFCLHKGMQSTERITYRATMLTAILFSSLAVQHLSVLALPSSEWRIDFSEPSCHQC